MPVDRMSPYAEARREGREARAAVRAVEMARPLQAIIDETLARRSGRTERLTSIRHSVRLEGHVDEVLARRSPRPAGTSRSVPAGLGELLAYARTFEKIPVEFDSAAAWGSPPTGGFTRGTAGRAGPRNCRFVTGFRNTSFRT